MRIALTCDLRGRSLLAQLNRTGALATHRLLDHAGMMGVRVASNTKSPVVLTKFAPTFTVLSRWLH